MEHFIEHKFSKSHKRIPWQSSGWDSELSLPWPGFSPWSGNQDSTGASHPRPRPPSSFTQAPAEVPPNGGMTNGRMPVGLLGGVGTTEGHGEEGNGSVGR